MGHTQPNSPALVHSLFAGLFGLRCRTSWRTFSSPCRYHAQLRSFGAAVGMGAFQGRATATSATCTEQDPDRNPALAAALKSVRRRWAEGQDFRIVTRESGAERRDLPIFTNMEGGVELESNSSEKPPVTREDLPHLGCGAFLLHNVLSGAECAEIIAGSEAMGYTEDAPVSLGRNIRRNENCVWIADNVTNSALFSRCAPLLPEGAKGGNALGLNARWRLYKYGPEDIFRTHTDGSWPGSLVDPGTGALLHDAFGDRWSQLTWVLYLNDDFAGGQTRFFKRSRGQLQHVGDVAAKQGSVLCFWHGEHPQSPLHEGALVTRGTKYIVRSDVLYPLRVQGAGRL
eukprot:TRINITY_DN26971_c0_g1_i1.p1 TRINITY_DN26971_c0_g1~~TRINITY_DN26971_c0_g1_i1.p1  ORF type:complete len:343 (+),score=38.07 TRINITY_DN26971_c0_g1_i1:169-1197(+)